MIRILFLTIAALTSINHSIYAQDTWSIIIENDTLTESGQDIVEYKDYLYVASGSRCQPDAQSCVMIRKMSYDGDIIWKVELPELTRSNENILHSYKNNLIITGRNNKIDDPQRFSYYEIDTEGNILDLTHINLPYESNFNYGSLIRGDTLYMYGASREDITEEGINVDGLIVTCDLVQDTFSYEYFDYGHDFVDIWDMRMVEDGSILFYSRHDRLEYVGDSAVWVVERLWPDGHRTTVYNQPYNSEGGVNVPQMEYLGDGLIALLFPNENPTIFTYPNIRIISLEGVVLVNQNYDLINPNSIRNTVDIRRTNDGAILICGAFNDKQIGEGDLPQSTDAYVSRMSRDGTIEWFRHFRAEANAWGHTVDSGFNTILSLSDNSIIAVGSIQHFPSDLYIVKLDENGCFGPDDCGGGVVTYVEEVLIEQNEASLIIYPNPAAKGQPLIIELSDYVPHTGSLTVHLMDAHGQNVHNANMTVSGGEVDTSKLVSGAYLVEIRDQEGRRLVIEKLIIL